MTILPALIRKLQIAPPAADDPANIEESRPHAGSTFKYRVVATGRAISVVVRRQSGVSQDLIAVSG